MIYYDISTELVRHSATIVRLCTTQCDFCTSFGSMFGIKGCAPPTNGLNLLFSREKQVPYAATFTSMTQSTNATGGRDLGLPQLLQQRRRREPRRFSVRPWILRRTDFGHYDRLMHELKVEDCEAFTNFLRVPSELFRELEHSN